MFWFRVDVDIRCYILYYYYILYYTYTLLLYYTYTYLILLYILLYYTILFSSLPPLPSSSQQSDLSSSPSLIYLPIPIFILYLSGVTYGYLYYSRLLLLSSSSHPIFFLLFPLPLFFLPSLPILPNILFSSQPPNLISFYL